MLPLGTIIHHECGLVPLWHIEVVGLLLENSPILLKFCATAPISTRFFTLSGLSMATLGAMIVPSL